jgi:hypothetical protein
MTEASQGTGGNSSAWSMPPIAGNPLLTAITGFGGKFLESVANAQKDWAEFVHLRVKEDIAASQQLLSCQSLTDMRDIYSQYLRTAIEQYRDHSEKIVQRSKSMTDELTHSMGAELGETRVRN